MGVDYFPCSNPECDETICDAGDYDTCEGCGSGFCYRCASSGLGLRNGYAGRGCNDEDDHPECILCTDDYTVRKIRRSELIAFLLTYTPFATEDDAVAALRQHHQNSGTEITQPVATPGLRLVIQQPH